jgi:DNA phosphorothioation-dependent restriction protein DptG
MDNQELIERLKRDIEDWKEQARLWEGLVGSRRDAKALAKRCRAKADQWAEVIKLLDTK